MRNCTKFSNCTILYRLKTVPNTAGARKSNGRNHTNVSNDIMLSGVRRTNRGVSRCMPLICNQVTVMLHNLVLYWFLRFPIDLYSLGISVQIGDFPKKCVFAHRIWTVSLRCFKNSFRANAGMNRNMDEVPSPYFYFLPNLFKKITTYLCETVQPIPICTNRSQTVQTEQNFQKSTSHRSTSSWYLSAQWKSWRQVAAGLRNRSRAAPLISVDFELSRSPKSELAQISVVLSCRRCNS